MKVILVAENRLKYPNTCFRLVFPGSLAHSPDELLASLFRKELLTKR